MNYTENCHLPQWDGDDRVLRTDFNEAFAVLEKIGTDHARVRAVADGLVRDAYRREVQGRVFHGLGGLTDGMGINALNSREEAGGDGHGWNGKYGVCHNDSGLPTLEGVAEGAKEEFYISTVPTYKYQSRKAAVTFTSNGYGTMDTVTLWAWHNSNYTDSRDFSLTVSCTRLDTGETIEAGPFTSYGHWFYPKVGFPLEPGISYRMEFKVPDGVENFYGEAGFALACTRRTVDVPVMTFSVREAEKTIVKSIKNPEAQSATGIVRWNGQGSVGLSVNNTPLTVLRTRETVNALGRACRETEFRAEQLPEEDFDVTLHMEPQESGLDVSDYGLIWE